MFVKPSEKCTSNLPTPTGFCVKGPLCTKYKERVQKEIEEPKRWRSKIAMGSLQTSGRNSMWTIKQREKK